MEEMEWIFFDMGYTLVNEDGAHEKRILAALEKLNSMGVGVTKEEFISEAFRYGSLGKPPIPRAAKHFGLNDVMKYSPDDGEAPYPDDREALLRLHKKYKLGIIANQPVGAEGRLERYGLGGIFDAVFASDEVALKKPDVEFYKYALKNAGCRPENAAMVGDRPDNDILPANMVGMKTVRIKRGFFRDMPDIVNPDMTVGSIDELARLLGT